MIDILKKAATVLKDKDLKVIFTECLDERILRAARMLKDKEICTPILLGIPDEIISAADSYHIPTEGFYIYNVLNEEKLKSLAESYAELIPSYSVKLLLRKIKKPLNLAAMLVKVGHADCMAAGVLYSTQDVILAAQQFIGLKPDVETVSSIGLQIIPSFDNLEHTKLLGVSDCAVCANPDVGQLASIAITSADSYRQIVGEEARVAMLSYSTLGSSEGVSVDLVREALARVKEMRPDLVIEGEYQIDTALVPEIASRKVKEESQVAGKANVLIFPDLNAGNMAVKCMQMFGQTDSYGPILQGFEKPVTDFSRSATVNDVVGNVSLCLMQGVK